jgi:hypothetical protein
MSWDSISIFPATAIGAVTQQAGLTEDAKRRVNAIMGSNSQSKHLAVTNCLVGLQPLLRRNASTRQPPCNDWNAADFPAVALHYQLFGLAPEQVECSCVYMQAYQDSLQVNNHLRLTDFALLQQEAYPCLKFAGSVSVFKHVIVDEYQDTNTIQERIFFQLASGTKNICVVGDDDQALYRFRGATVENFVEFPGGASKYLGH